MKTIIIPDIHLSVERTDSILLKESPYDKVIYQNDIFDQFNDTPERNRNAAVWLKEKLQDPRHIFLWSNHVQSYAYDFNQNMMCSGFTREKAKLIWEVLTREDFNKLKLYYIEQGFLFTHAGLSNALIKIQNNNQQIETLEEIRTFLDYHYERAKLAIEAGGNHWLFAAGRDRGGTEKIGGCTWCDFYSHVPTPFPQIFAHTPQSTPIFMTMNDKGGMSKFAAKDAQVQNFKNKRFSLDLDTHLNDYAVLEDGILTVNNIIWKNSWQSNAADKNEIKTVVRLFKGKIT